MPRFGFATGKAETSLNEKFKNLDFIRKKLYARADRLEAAVKEKFAELIEKELNSSRVIRLLKNPSTGFGGYDLPAEFGLSDEAAKDGIAVITQILKNAIQQKDILNKTFLPSRRSLIVETGFNYLDKKMYEGALSRYLTYTSTKKYLPNKERKATMKARRYARKRGIEYTAPEPHEIPWGKWLMEASRGKGVIRETLPDIDQYGIAYNLNSLQQAVSRSGRALMLSGHRQRNLARIGNFPYEFPRGAKPLAGNRNFVEEIANDTAFNKKLTREVLKLINRILFPR